MLTGLLSFFGIIIGALLQYVFTRHIENQRHLRELRSNAYMDYLKCVCDQAQLRPKDGTQEKKELFAKTGNAKARICLYGSNQVIHAFSVFEELGASMNNAEQRNAFTSMVAIMRSDSGNKDAAKANELQNILLGTHD